MEPQVGQELDRMIDRYVDTEDLNTLLKQFINDKCKEGTIWSKLTLHVHFMLGGRSPSVYRLAALTELIILALDIVDDLQDRDNPEKPWMVCPAEFSLNAVLAMLMSCAAEAPPEVTKGLAELVLKSVNGQQMDLNKRIATEQDYMEMAAAKSGALIQLACYMGIAGVDGLDADTVRTLDELASLIGIIAQLSNDIHDVSQVSRKNDILMKKRTLPILYLLRDADSEMPALSRYYAGELSPEEFLTHKLECLDYIRTSGCQEYSRVIQSLLMERAEALYRKLDLRSPWKEAFRDMTFAPRSGK